jgi:DNA primase
MTLSPQFLDDLRVRVSLSTLVGRTVKLQRAGREWKACCPFHKEKTPSFYVNDEKGFYHCFGCSAHGDAIRWLTDVRGLSFMDAVKELADATGMEMPAADPRAQEKAERAAGLHAVMQAAQRWFEEQLGGIDGAGARAYLGQRGISEATRRRFGFGYAPDARGKLRAALKEFGIDTLVEAGLLIAPEDEREPYDRFRGRLTFPIRDQRGRVIAFSARILGPGEPKYLNSPDTPLFDKGRTLFNIDKAATASRSAGRVVVVEGQMDVIALDQAGIGEAVAPLGTAVTEAQLGLLWRMSPCPVVCFDGDAAGQKAAVRVAMRALPMLAPERSLAFLILPKGMDPDDVVRAGGAAAFEEELSRRVPLDKFIWNAEYEAADFDTPEGRAAFGRRLREYARLVGDLDIRTQYLAIYKQRLNELFSPQSQQRFTEGGRWLKRGLGPRPELLAIKNHGTSKALFAPAALEGLRRYPEVMSSHAEVVGQMSLLLLHRDLKLVCHEMLDAALGDPGLDEGSLQLALKKAGLEHILHRLSGRRRVGFSFLRRAADPGRARADLAAVLEILAATPEIEAALRIATERLKAEGDEEAFDHQRRMRGLRERLDLDWADLLQGTVQSNTAEAH